MCDDKDNYRFGYDGQEKVNEIAGIGNHNTALFWEYDTRLGRRWNQDPKGITNVSDYAAFKNNPIIFVDPLGDFNSKFGAWAYQKLHGTGGDVQKDGNGEWFINKNSTENGEIVIRPAVYDWNGSSQSYNGSGWGHQVRSFMASAFGVNGKSSSLKSVILNSILENSSVQLTGNLLERVKQDPAILAMENDLVSAVQGDSRYGKEAFSLEYSKGLQFGGKRGSLNPFDKNSAATWKVAGNPLTWVVRSANVQAAVEVNATGSIHIIYKFVDNLDLRPEKGGKVFFGGKGNSPFSSDGGNRPWQYNATNSILGVPYHDVLGGNDNMKIKATWTSDK